MKRLRVALVVLAMSVSACGEKGDTGPMGPPGPPGPAGPSAILGFASVCASADCVAGHCGTGVPCVLTVGGPSTTGATVERHDAGIYTVHLTGSYSGVAGGTDVSVLVTCNNYPVMTSTVTHEVEVSATEISFPVSTWIIDQTGNLPTDADFAVVVLH